MNKSPTSIADAPSLIAAPNSIVPPTPAALGADGSVQKLAEPVVEHHAGVGLSPLVVQEEPFASPTANRIDPDANAETKLTFATALPRQVDWNSVPITLSARQIHKTYFRGSPVPVLRGVDLLLRQSEFISIIGMSGSGKSTLLHLLGLLDRPDQGEIYWYGERIDNCRNRHRERFRNQVVGLVFQFYHLLPELTVRENVMLPGLVQIPWYRAWGSMKELRQRADELLEQVGLTHRAHHKPSQLSGGELQRTAIARALVTKPQLLLADEPTGNLDHETGERVMSLLLELTRQNQLAVVMVTHDAELAKCADRTLKLVHGQLVQADHSEPA